jgi:restriction endonuclease fold toxin 7 of polymorphic toxin system
VRLAEVIDDVSGEALQICEELANIKLVLDGLEGLANIKGALGEGLVRDAYGSLGMDVSKPTTPVTGPVTGKGRLPDLNVGPSDLVEVKNVNYQAYTAQLKDSVALAEERGGTLTLFTRASTKLSEPLKAAARSGVLRIIGCLSG